MKRKSISRTQYHESAQDARRKSHTESTEITERILRTQYQEIREIREIRVRNRTSVLSVRSNFRVSLFFSRYFAINKMTVYAMEWECENTRKSENHAKIDIAAAISL